MRDVPPVGFSQLSWGVHTAALPRSSHLTNTRRNHRPLDRSSLDRETTFGSADSEPASPIRNRTQGGVAWKTQATHQSRPYHGKFVPWYHTNHLCGAPTREHKHPWRRTALLDGVAPISGFVHAQHSSFCETIIARKTI